MLEVDLFIEVLKSSYFLPNFLVELSLYVHMIAILAKEMLDIQQSFLAADIYLADLESSVRWSSPLDNWVNINIDGVVSHALENAGLYSWQLFN